MTNIKTKWHDLESEGLVRESGVKKFHDWRFIRAHQYASSKLTETIHASFLITYMTELTYHFERLVHSVPVKKREVQNHSFSG